MRRVAWIVLFLLVVVACSDDRGADTRHEDIRARAAEGYGYLVEGDIDRYLSLIHDYDSLPEEYRTQLYDMFAQYLDKEQRMRGGLVGAQVLGDTILDSVRADAFVELQFGDSTHEQVSLPMVYKRGKWMLK